MLGHWSNAVGPDEAPVITQPGGLSRAGGGWGERSPDPHSAFLSTLKAKIWLLPWFWCQGAEAQSQLLISESPDVFAGCEPCREGRDGDGFLVSSPSPREAAEPGGGGCAASFHCLSTYS